jgi:hypothetical protein
LTPTVNEFPGRWAGLYDCYASPVIAALMPGGKFGRGHFQEEKAWSPPSKASSISERAPPVRRTKESAPFHTTQQFAAPR